MFKKLCGCLFPYNNSSTDNQAPIPYGDDSLYYIEDRNNIDIKIREHLSKNLYFYENNNKNKEIEECAICLEEFKDKELIIFFNCKHYFHRKCAIAWLEKKKDIICPLCNE